MQPKRKSNEKRRVYKVARHKTSGNTSSIIQEDSEKTRAAQGGKPGRVTTEGQGRPQQTGPRPPSRPHTTAQERREKKIQKLQTRKGKEKKRLVEGRGRVRV